ncbi:hypothetical protein H0H92_001619 [Tricholoma furcatifolium]|nr:hypothetical protein H0H92_001619 [Tricholoma furcatifolium]
MDEAANQIREVLGSCQPRLRPNMNEEERRIWLEGHPLTASAPGPTQVLCRCGHTVQLENRILPEGKTPPRFYTGNFIKHTESCTLYPHNQSLIDDYNRTFWDDGRSKSEQVPRTRRRSSPSRATTLARARKNRAPRKAPSTLKGKGRRKGKSDNAAMSESAASPASERSSSARTGFTSSPSLSPNPESRGSATTCSGQAEASGPPSASSWGSWPQAGAQALGAVQLPASSSSGRACASSSPQPWNRRHAMDIDCLLNPTSPGV